MICRNLQRGDYLQNNKNADFFLNAGLEIKEKDGVTSNMKATPSFKVSH